MDNGKSSDIFNFAAEFNDDGEINLSVERINEIYSQGFKKIKLLFADSPQDSSNEMIVDLELYNRIKDFQKLPEYVVRDFLIVKGKLKKTNIEERIKF